MLLFVVSAAAVVVVVVVVVVIIIVNVHAVNVVVSVALRLAGVIPESLGQLTHLTRLDLSGSELTGKLPRCIV